MFKVNLLVIMIGFRSHVHWIGKYSVVLELYAKVYVKMAKVRLQKKCYNFVIK